MVLFLSLKLAQMYRLLFSLVVLPVIQAASEGKVFPHLLLVNYIFVKGFDAWGAVHVVYYVIG